MKKIRHNGYYAYLTSQATTARFVVFDTETYISKKGKITEFPFRLGCMILFTVNKNAEISKRKVVQLYSTDNFIEELTEYTPKKNKTYVLAHNIGFDIRVLRLVHRLKELGYKSEPPIINNRVFMWTVSKDTRKFVFLDTANFGVESVASLGTTINLQKGSVNFETISDGELYKYCLRDTEILEQFVANYYTFILKNELGRFKPTLASQSMVAFRTRFMDENPYVHHCQPSLRLERQAYHGGRTECFTIGNPHLAGYYKLDVNSMYPAVMLKFDYPNKFLFYLKNITYSRFIKFMSENYCIADVIIDTNKPYYAIVKDHKLVFPVGRFQTQLHHCELQRAIEHGHIVKVLAVSVYDKAKFFDSYVNFFYDTKIQSEKDGNKAWRFIAKLFMNSLYGKFGQSGKHRDRVATCEPEQMLRVHGYDATEEMAITLIYWNGEIYKDYDGGESYLSVPSIAGAVTAYAREMLMRYIELAGFENVFYVDTDSLITNREGFTGLNSFIDKYSLGYLKLEEVSNRLIIYGNKDYIFGHKAKVKGISVKARKINKEQWETLQFEGFLAWLSAGQETLPKATIIKKHRVSKYNKGIVSSSNHVYPIIQSVAFVLALVAGGHRALDCFHLSLYRWRDYLIQG